MLRFLTKWKMWLIGPSDGARLGRPWLVDRDGRVYLPDRRVELCAR